MLAKTSVKSVMAVPLLQQQQQQQQTTGQQEQGPKQELHETTNHYTHVGPLPGSEQNPQHTLLRAIETGNLFAGKIITGRSDEHDRIRAMSAASLMHELRVVPGVAAVVGVMENAESVTLVTPFVPGGSLRQVIAQRNAHLQEWIVPNGRPTPVHQRRRQIPTSPRAPSDTFFREEEVLKLLRQITEALRLMHAKRIVHGALSTEHIILADPDVMAGAKLCGFSRARRVQPHQSVEAAARDIWALGAVAYEMCTLGTHLSPELESLPLSPLVSPRGCHGGPRAPIPRRYSRWLDDMLRLMLAKDKTARPSARRLLEMLQDPPRLRSRRSEGEKSAGLTPIGFALPTWTLGAPSPGHFSYLSNSTSIRSAQPDGLDALDATYTVFHEAIEGNKFSPRASPRPRDAWPIGNGGNIFKKPISQQEEESIRDIFGMTTHSCEEDHNSQPHNVPDANEGQVDPLSRHSDITWSPRRGTRYSNGVSTLLHDEQRDTAHVLCPPLVLQECLVPTAWLTKVENITSQHDIAALSTTSLSEMNGSYRPQTAPQNQKRTINKPSPRPPIATKKVKERSGQSHEARDTKSLVSLEQEGRKQEATGENISRSELLLTAPAPRHHAPLKPFPPPSTNPQTPTNTQGQSNSTRLPSTTPQSGATYTLPAIEREEVLARGRTVVARLVHEEQLWRGALAQRAHAERAAAMGQAQRMRVELVRRAFEAEVRAARERMEGEETTRRNELSARCTVEKGSARRRSLSRHVSSALEGAEVRDEAKRNGAVARLSALDAEMLRARQQIESAEASARGELRIQCLTVEERVARRTMFRHASDVHARVRTQMRRSSGELWRGALEADAAHTMRAIKREEVLARADLLLDMATEAKGVSSVCASVAFLYARETLLPNLITPQPHHTMETMEKGVKCAGVITSSDVMPTRRRCAAPALTRKELEEPLSSLSVTFTDATPVCVVGRASTPFRTPLSHSIPSHVPIPSPPLPYRAESTLVRAGPRYTPGDALPHTSRLSVHATSPPAQRRLSATWEDGGKRHTHQRLDRIDLKETGETRETPSPRVGEETGLSSSGSEEISHSPLSRCTLRKGETPILNAKEEKGTDGLKRRLAGEHLVEGRHGCCTGCSMQ